MTPLASRMASSICDRPLSGSPFAAMYCALAAAPAAVNEPGTIADMDVIGAMDAAADAAAVTVGSDAHMRHSFATARAAGDSASACTWDANVAVVAAPAVLVFMSGAVINVNRVIAPVIHRLLDIGVDLRWRQIRCRGRGGGTALVQERCHTVIDLTVVRKLIKSVCMTGVAAQHVPNQGPAGGADVIVQSPVMGVVGSPARPATGPYGAYSWTS